MSAYNNDLGDIFERFFGGAAPTRGTKCQRKGCDAAPAKSVMLFRSMQRTDLCTDHVEEARSYGWLA